MKIINLEGEDLRRIGRYFTNYLELDRIRFFVDGFKLGKRQDQSNPIQTGPERVKERVYNAKKSDIPPRH